jgi:isoamylase
MSHWPKRSGDLFVGMFDTARMQTWPGEPYPLGATYDGYGTNFAIHSQVAQKIELCLFDERGRETRVAMQEATAFTWHAFLPQVGPGQRYGFRVYGPFAPDLGHLCNPNKLLLDPYARAIDGVVEWHSSVFDFDERSGQEVQRQEDSAPYVPRSVVVDPYFDWREERRPKIPWHETIIYELHVKGFSKLNAEVPRELRGTYAGLAHPASIEYLKALGVTAVELLPIQHFLTEPLLSARGKTNYWGYNTIGYFAPHKNFCSRPQAGEQLREFKYMVRELHAANIEVLLDVVYNHTAESGRGGPTLCLRGLDNANYYRLDPQDRRRYVDYTGCGNTMNMRDPYVLQLLMDSLRYWVTEMHVDGFRFDLASALARELHAVDRLSAFFDLIQQDPVLQGIKLIAEPWDLGEGGYQVGNFPPKWSEWNGRYRDSVRDFWRGRDQSLGEFALRLTGSSDLYERTGRRPHASINFVTAHDGFTLRDLTSYNDKHNLDNGEDNRDGESHNRSWNCGVEGVTDNPVVLQLRARQQRNFILTLMLSQGVPMLNAGDEHGRSQGGNNNPYCQDNEISWLNWANQDRRLLAFTREAIKLRQSHAIFRRSQFFQGESIRGANLTDIGWFRPDGEEMTDKDWHTHFARAIGVFLNGQGLRTKDARGERIIDDSFLLFFNAHNNYVDFTLPRELDEHVWRDELTTAWPELNRRRETFKVGDLVRVEAHAIRLLRRRRKQPPARSSFNSVPSRDEPVAAAINNKI